MVSDYGDKSQKGLKDDIAVTTFLALLKLDKSQKGLKAEGTSGGSLYLSRINPKRDWKSLYELQV